MVLGIFTEFDCESAFNPKSERKDIRKFIIINAEFVNAEFLYKDIIIYNIIYYILMSDIIANAIVVEPELELDMSLYSITKFYFYSYIELGKYIRDNCCPIFC